MSFTISEGVITLLDDLERVDRVPERQALE